MRRRETLAQRLHVYASNAIKELFGKVLVQGRVLVNLFAGGEFTFAGLVRHYSLFSIISISSGHPPFVHFGWGGLPISALDGEGSPCPPWMGRAPYLGSSWGVLPIQSSDKDGSRSLLQMGRASYPGFSWGVLRNRA
jgi:hypothetical protein